MTRNEFKKVVKAFSKWRTDKRRGNYRLPSGVTLGGYLDHLVWDLLRNNSLGIGSDGNIHDVITLGAFDSEEQIMLVPGANGEPLIMSEQEARARKIVDEII